MKILVSGLINQETNVNVHKFPIDYEPIVYAFNEVTVALSGVAFNIINALNTLGDDIVPVSIIGKDTIGRLIKNELKSLKLKTDFIKEDLDESCTSAILFDDTGKRKVFCDLKNIQDKVFPVSILENEIKTCNGLVICNINFNDELIKKAKSFGKTVFTDVHVLSNIEDEYNKRFLENADVVFLSDEGISGNYEDFLLSIYKKYKNKVIVLGMGSKGAMILDEKSQKIYFVESVHVRPVVNTVGAGDSLFSCFVHFYTKGENALECLKKAVTFASYKIGQSGGAVGFIDENSLQKFCENITYSVSEVKDI